MIKLIYEACHIAHLKIVVR